MAVTLNLRSVLGRALTFLELDANWTNIKTELDKLGGYLASLTPAANQIPVINASSVLALPGGVKFPAVQVPSADVNTLDDYEEGTFTPTAAGSSSAGVGTYSIQVGHYTKIGREVFYRLTVAWSAHTGTGGLRITGLPFTSNAAANSYAIGATYFNGLTVGAGKQLVTYIAPGTSQVVLNAADPAGGGTAELNGSVLDTSVALLAISGSYMT